MNLISGITLLPLPVCFPGETRDSALNLARNTWHFPNWGVADIPELFRAALELCTQTAQERTGRNVVLGSLKEADIGVKCLNFQEQNGKMLT